MIKGYMRRRIQAASDSKIGAAETDYYERQEGVEYLERVGFRELVRLYREWVICK